MSGNEGSHVTVFFHDAGDGRTAVEITAEPRRRMLGAGEERSKLADAYFARLDAVLAGAI